MESYDIKRLGLILAIQAEIEGMKIENETGISYDQRHFDEKAEQLRNLATCHGEQL